MNYHLGTLVCPPLPLEGGFLHRMYSLFTTKGKYAVKLLNPHIMQRDTAMENYRMAEDLELLLEQQDLPILPALIFSGKKMQCMDGQYFYLYDWYDGKALHSGEITEFHCRTIGVLLARIHRLDRRQEPCSRSEFHVNWDEYIEALSAKGVSQQDSLLELSRLIAQNLSLLYEYQEKGNLAAKKLPPVVSICHNDMDSKNVLWLGKDCRVIDLECLCYSNPFVELYETALSWSGCDCCRIDYSLLRCLVSSYMEAGDQAAAFGESSNCMTEGNNAAAIDWETLYWSSMGRLEWLEYNIKRALGIGCSTQEIGLGISQAKYTMEQIFYYYKAREEILNCLGSLVIFPSL